MTYIKANMSDIGEGSSTPARAQSSMETDVDGDEQTTALSQDLEDENLAEMTVEDIRELYDAVKTGDIDLVDDLLDRPGADINIELYCNNLLMVALKARQDEMALFLIDNGIDCNRKLICVDKSPKGLVEWYSTSCRQMAYDMDFPDVVDAIDAKNGLLWPMTVQQPRNIRKLSRPQIKTQMQRFETKSDDTQSEKARQRLGGDCQTSSGGKERGKAESTNTAIENTSIRPLSRKTKSALVRQSRNTRSRNSHDDFGTGPCSRPHSVNGTYGPEKHIWHPCSAPVSPILSGSPLRVSYQPWNQTDREIRAHVNPQPNLPTSAPSTPKKSPRDALYSMSQSSAAENYLSRDLVRHVLTRSTPCMTSDYASRTVNLISVLRHRGLHKQATNSRADVRKYSPAGLLATKPSIGRPVTQAVSTSTDKQTQAVSRAGHGRLKH